MASEIAFIDGEILKYGRLVAAAINHRPFDATEFIVGASAEDAFVFTNRALYLYTSDNPFPNQPLIIPLCEIEEYRLGSPIAIKLRSGETKYPLTRFAPKEELVNRFCREARGTDVSRQSGGNK
jgi:hypothetical protein